MKETWKEINNEPNYYVSNYGRIKNQNGRILKGTITEGGYNRVIIRNKSYLVHRLVGIAFIPNPNNLPMVLHKISIRNGGSNNANNLYWGTRSDNTKDMIRDDTWNKPRRKHYNPRRVKQYNLNGNLIKEWKGATYTPYNARHIYEVCSGKRKSANGYIWKWS